MKLNKFKIVFFIIVLLTLVVSIGILGVEWTRHLELKTNVKSRKWKYELYRKEIRLLKT